MHKNDDGGFILFILWLLLMVFFLCCNGGWIGILFVNGAILLSWGKVGCRRREDQERMKNALGEEMYKTYQMWYGYDEDKK